MTGAIERAFQLAKSGQYRSVSEVIRHLPLEDREAATRIRLSPMQGDNLSCFAANRGSQSSSLGHF